MYPKNPFLFSAPTSNVIRSRWQKKKKKTWQLSAIGFNLLPLTTNTASKRHVTFSLSLSLFLHGSALSNALKHFIAPCHVGFVSNRKKAVLASVFHCRVPPFFDLWLICIQSFRWKAGDLKKANNLSSSRDSCLNLHSHWTHLDYSAWSCSRVRLECER